MNVLIIGGTSGLGLELARAHVSVGHAVTVCGRRTLVEPGVASVSADVGHNDGMQELLLQLEAMPSPDRLVWSAGFSKLGRVDEIDNGDIASIVTLSITSLAQVVGFILERKGMLRSLVGVTSTSGYVPRAAEPVYAAAKAGMSMLLRSLALDERLKQVLEIAPAGMRTSFWDLDDGQDRSTFLEPQWVSQETMRLLADSRPYRVVKILRDPSRVEVVK